MLSLLSNTSTHLDYQNTHRKIIEACRAGDRSSQYELYSLYSKAMYNICLRMVKNEMDAEDMLQSSFTDVFTKLHSFNYQASIGAWIKRIVINNCINFLKKRKLQLQELNETHDYYSPEEDQSTQPAYSVETIKRAIFELPDGYRVVFSLYAMEGYDHSEIASILGVSEATSKSQYSRAKGKLRTLLKEKRLNQFG